MSRNLPFYFVDVFADSPLQGNSLAVVDKADDLDDADMRAIAREFNQSETTFILSPTDAAAMVRLRSFTAAGAEVFGAGHNALGAWLWLLESTAGRALLPGTLAQQIGGDLLTVEASHAADGRLVVTMAQSAPVFGATATDRIRLSAALGLEPASLVPDDDAQVVSTGAAHLLVRVADRNAVDAAAPRTNELAALLAGVGGEGCLVYTLDTVAAESAAYARFFNPTMGITEDPATGTAAGPLVALLVARGHVPDGQESVIEQGFALGRPSLIRVFVGGQHVRISGSGLVVASGALHA
jgi:PhzF family phenazine biosynthesis protein